MSEDIKPELIEKAAQAMHADNCIDDDCDHYVNEWERDAEVALAAVLPDVIRQAKAEAWDEGKAAGLRQSDWEHGDTAEMYVATNPYRDDRIEPRSTNE